MKRLLACVSLVAITTTAAVSSPAPAVKPTAKPIAKHVPALKVPIVVAPADEYFGKLKMSILGIRNTIKDVGANLDIDQTRWTQLASKAAFAEDAMRDWEHKYPHDTWLAKTVFSLERMYAKLGDGEGRRHAIAAMQWLVRDFPTSWYAKSGKRELAQGKVGRPVGTAQVSPLPGPSPTLSPAQIAAPGAFPSPSAESGAAPIVGPDAAGGATPVPNAFPSSSPVGPAPNHQ